MNALQGMSKEALQALFDHIDEICDLGGDVAFNRLRKWFIEHGYADESTG